MIKLKIPDYSDKDRVLDMVNEIKNYDNNFEGGLNLLKSEIYDNWMDIISKEQYKNKISEKMVPQTTFLAYDNDELIGIINTRHYLNEALLNHGGHVGYLVRPAKRGMGYCTKMVKLCLVEYEKMNINKILITCREENIASSKVLEKCGGIKDKDFIDEKTKQVYKRYWISI